MVMIKQSLDPNFAEATKALVALKWVRHNSAPIDVEDEIYKRIISLFSAGSESVRYLVITKLIELGDRYSRPLLKDVLKNGENALLRHEAAFGLGIFGERSDEKALIEALMTDPDEIVRHEAAIALAEVGDKESLMELEEVSQNDSDLVSYSAKYAIQNILLAKENG